MVASVAWPLLWGARVKRADHIMEQLLGSGAFERAPDGQRRRRPGDSGLGRPLSSQPGRPAPLERSSLICPSILSMGGWPCACDEVSRLQLLLLALPAEPESGASRRLEQDGLRWSRAVRRSSSWSSEEQLPAGSCPSDGHSPDRRAQLEEEEEEEDRQDDGERDTDTEADAEADKSESESENDRPDEDELLQRSVSSLSQQERRRLLYPELVWPRPRCRAEGALALKRWLHSSARVSSLIIGRMFQFEAAEHSM